MLTTSIYMTNAEVCIKATSPPASLPFKGQVTEKTTVKWSIVVELGFSQRCAMKIVKIVLSGRNLMDIT